jgi:hypothetical protein
LKTGFAWVGGAMALSAATLMSACGAQGGQSTAIVPSAINAVSHTSSIISDQTVVQTHVLTWDALGGGSGSSVSPTQAGPWLNYAMVQAGDAAAARAAGIKAVLYTDPGRQHPGDFAFTTDETTYAHDCSGNRIAVEPNPDPNSVLMNVHSTHLAQLWQQYVKNTESWAGPVDVVFDDTADEMGKVLGSPCDFNQSAWTAATNTMNASVGAPILYNGLGATTVVGTTSAMSPSIGLNPTTIGGMAEECYMTRSSAGYDRNAWWQAMEDTELTMTNRNKMFVCHSTDFVDASQNAAGRIYYYASFLLSYSVKHSMTDEEFMTPDNFHVFPESQLVALNPLSALPTNISGEAQAAGGYGRQYAHCYLAGQPIGACAAFVNPNSSNLKPVAFPWPTVYSHTLVVSGYDVLGGGTVSASGPAPSALIPGTSAVIAIQ